MSGAPDPMMHFPHGTSFTPFSVLYNNSSSNAAVLPEVFWTDHGTAHRKKLQGLNVPALGTVSLDTALLLAQAGLADYNGVLNLTFTTATSSAALLLASGSVDKSNTYVFQVAPHIVQESWAKTISYWSVANGDDTMVTVWNPADEPQDSRLTLTYEGDDYIIPLHLEGRATRMLTLAAVINDQLPDDRGRITPRNIREGSARLSGTHGDNEITLVDLDAGSYNVQKATCSYYCISCDGIITTGLTSPIDFGFDGLLQLSFSGTTNTGYTYDLSSQATYSSDNNNVATVSSTGSVTGIAHGSFTASAYKSALFYSNSFCAYNAACPDSGTMGTSQPGTITDNTPVLSGVSPSEWVAGTTTPGVVFSGMYFGTNPPTLAFSPSDGITYTVVSNTDTQLVANVSVAAGVPNEDVSITLVNTGYGGNSFQSGGGAMSPKSSPIFASVHAPLNAPEITVIGRVDANAPDLANLSTAGVNSTLLAKLNGIFFWLHRGGTVMG